MIKKILSDVEDNKHRKRRHGIFHNIPPAPPLPRRLDDDFGKEIKRATQNLKNTLHTVYVAKFESSKLLVIFSIEYISHNITYHENNQS